MKRNILFTQKSREFQGKYIAVARNRIVASGKDAKETFASAKKILGPQKVEGIYYVPRKKDLLTALCVFHNYQLGPGNFAPIITLKVLGKEGWIDLEAYVDSGASFSIFNVDRAEILGLDYKKGKRLFLTVGDGGLLEVLIHKLKVNLANQIFIADIGFSKQLGVGFNLLGRGSFFDRFQICFNDKLRFLEMSLL